MAKADTAKPKAKAKTKPKLTDKERHKRFVETARAVEAVESQSAFDKAFDAVVIQGGKSKQGA